MKVSCCALIYILFTSSGIVLGSAVTKPTALRDSTRPSKIGTKIVDETAENHARTRSEFNNVDQTAAIGVGKDRLQGII